MEILTLVVSMFETNCYLAHDSGTQKGIIIDPGDEADRIASEIERLGFKPEMIVLTHGHVDHIGAVSDLMEKYSLPLLAGRGEEPLLKSSAENMSAMIGNPIVIPPPDDLLKEGDIVSFGTVKMKVLETPGHSPGGICLYDDGTVFCGDTLFYGSVGRTDFPGCSHKLLIDSIRNKLLNLPDDTVCYPGHGPSTTIGAEKKHNPFLAGGDFV